MSSTHQLFFHLGVMPHDKRAALVFGALESVVGKMRPGSLDTFHLPALMAACRAYLASPGEACQRALSDAVTATRVALPTLSAKQPNSSVNALYGALNLGMSLLKGSDASLLVGSLGFLIKADPWIEGDVLATLEGSLAR